MDSEKLVEKVARAIASRKIYDGIQMVCAGNNPTDVLQALLDSVAGSIAFSCASLDEADSIIDTLPDDLKRSVRTNWDYVKSLPHHGAGDA